MAMRKSRRERRSAQRRRRGNLKIAFAKCAGECKVFLTKILTDPIVTQFKADPANPGADPKGKDTDTASTDLKTAIAKWGEPVDLEPKCKAGCDCTEIDTDEVDWNKKKSHTRTFEAGYESKKKKFIIFAEIEFKVAIVTRACLEPKDKPIKPA